MASSNGPVSQNERVWTSILQSNPAILESIQENGHFDIESKEIKTFREPRLACKFDFKQHIPKVLEQQSLSVLAIRNGVYRIAPTNPYLNLPEVSLATSIKPTLFRLPTHIKALSPELISSEAKALDAALISGMLDFVFQDQVQLVLRGYERSSRFSFSLPNRLRTEAMVDYDIDGVQIEVDGGYEGQNGIYLVEAKNKVNDNINIRQLLYPQLHYQEKLGFSKTIKTYLMLYDDHSKLYHFSHLPVEQITDSHSHFSLPDSDFVTCKLQLPLEDYRNYWVDLFDVPVENSMVNDDRPFPQADDFAKILALLTTVQENVDISLDELFLKYSLVPRQYDYYANALRWLGLTHYRRDTRSLSLSNRGKEIMSIVSPSATLFEIAKIAVSNDIFNQYLHYGRDRVSFKARIRNRLHSDRTFDRRLITVKAWLGFFEQNLSMPELAQTS